MNMNSTIQSVGTIITITIVLGSLVYNIALIRAAVAENKTAIAERKLTGKTVRSHGNRLTKIETTLDHYSVTHERLLKRDDDTNEKASQLRARVRVLEQKK